MVLANTRGTPSLNATSRAAASSSLASGCCRRAIRVASLRGYVVINDAPSIATPSGRSQRSVEHRVVRRRPKSRSAPHRRCAGAGADGRDASKPPHTHTYRDPTTAVAVPMSTSLRRPSGRVAGCTRSLPSGPTFKIGDQLGSSITLDGIHVQILLHHLTVSAGIIGSIAVKDGGPCASHQFMPTAIVRLHLRTAAGRNRRNQTECVDVAPLIGGVAARLLRGHVLERADTDPGSV